VSATPTPSYIIIDTRSLDYWVYDKVSTSWYHFELILLLPRASPVRCCSRYGTALHNVYANCISVMRFYGVRQSPPATDIRMYATSCNPQFGMASLPVCSITPCPHYVREDLSKLCVEIRDHEATKSNLVGRLQWYVPAWSQRLKDAHAARVTLRKWRYDLNRTLSCQLKRSVGTLSVSTQA